MNWKIFWHALSKVILGVVAALFLAVGVAVTGDLTHGISTILIIVVFFLVTLRDKYKDDLK